MRKRKKAIAKKSEAKPEIYIRVAEGGWLKTNAYARAHVRVKAGGYQYLTWRDGERVRSIYLGKKRDS